MKRRQDDIRGIFSGSSGRATACPVSFDLRTAMTAFTSFMHYGSWGRKSKGLRTARGEGTCSAHTRCPRLLGLSPCVPDSSFTSLFLVMPLCSSLECLCALMLQISMHLFSNSPQPFQIVHTSWWLPGNCRAQFNFYSNLNSAPWCSRMQSSPARLPHHVKDGPWWSEPSMLPGTPRHSRLMNEWSYHSHQSRVGNKCNRTMKWRIQTKR